jgi:phage-related protein
MNPPKPVEFLGSSLRDLRNFPMPARQEAGYQIDRVQNGLMPADWKPLPTIGTGVKEIRIHEADGAFRVIYLAKLAGAVYVLHYFQKKTQKTSDSDIDIAVKRYRDLIRGN